MIFYFFLIDLQQVFFSVKLIYGKSSKHLFESKFSKRLSMGKLKPGHFYLVEDNV